MPSHYQPINGTIVPLIYFLEPHCPVADSITSQDRNTPSWKPTFRIPYLLELFTHPPPLLGPDFSLSVVSSVLPSKTSIHYHSSVLHSLRSMAAPSSLNWTSATHITSSTSETLMNRVLHSIPHFPFRVSSHKRPSLFSTTLSMTSSVKL